MGRIPFHMVGTHRRIALRDLLKYRQASLRGSRDAMDELVEQAQDLNLGY
jgi:hypothetical protein